MGADSREFMEFVAVPDTFCSGCASIEHIGHGMLRVTYYVIEHGGRTIVAKLIMAAAAIPEMREMVNAAIAQTLPEMLPLLPGAIPPLLS